MSWAIDDEDAISYDVAEVFGMDVSAKQVEVPQCLEKYVNDNTSNFELIEKAKDDIVRFENEIRILLSKKMSAINKIRQASYNVLTSLPTLDFIRCEEMYNEFNKTGFRSNEVRAFVHDLRELFFDDSKKRFQDIVCTKLFFDKNNYGFGHLDVRFEDTKSSNQFSIMIQLFSKHTINRFKKMFSSCIEHYDVQVDVFKYMNCRNVCQTMSLVCPTKLNMRHTIIAHYDIRNIREAILKFVNSECIDFTPNNNFKKYIPSIGEFKSVE